MTLSSITPLVITWNEEPNLRRCLDRLQWADQILVIDSGSTDGTLGICGSYPNVRVLARPFDNFANQCNFGLEQVGTTHVLSLDADYIVPEDFPGFVPGLDEHSAYRFPFRYCVFGKPLRACLYPPRAVLYPRSAAFYEEDGHAHRVRLSCEVRDAAMSIDHDDRKPLSRWVQSQWKYAVLEAEKLAEQNDNSLPDRLRRMIWPAAPAAFLYTLFVKRAILDGWAGWFYALQRTYAELLLSLILLEKRLCRAGAPPAP